ncbi:MAG TPA: YfhO family protein, partial [Phycisphaerae bacterium]|nr:YfhO family protein [Phycisphaerae bacterium]
KRFAALIGAIGFEMAGFLVAHRAHLTVLEACAWLPWLFHAWRRFAGSGAYRHFATAAIVLGLQMLVQHMQVTIIGLTLLTVYVLVVLWPGRQHLAWQYPLGVALGVMLSGIQLIPTLFFFASSGRSAAAYHLFVENSWWPGSAVLMLFPMLYGARTPNIWDQPWWGMSHFCEQWAYPSILVLVLALASLSLIRKRPDAARRWRREVLFWWGVIIASTILALGRHTPLSEWLFNVPIYRNLRVPARWILVWSFALPVLASTAATVLLAGGDGARRTGRAVRRAALGIVPLLTAVVLAAMFLARWRLDEVIHRFPDPWFAGFFDGLRAAVRPDNPAIWFPVGCIVLTCATAVIWSRRPGRGASVVLCLVFLVDISSVTAFVDVDTKAYQQRDIEQPPPLTEAIRELEPRAGERLLVPRFSASYDRPIEVLWPQTNVRHGVATLNGYGPLWPAGHRLLLRFMPWGSSESILSLLADPAMCRALGVRFLAVRSTEERRLLETARWPRLPNPEVQPIAETSTGMRPVRAGEDLLWSVRIDQPGIYELRIEIESGGEPSGRGFVRLETVAGEGIDRTFSIEPVDWSLGRRQLRWLLRCDGAVGDARVRVKSERGWSMSVGHAAFGRIASPSGPAGSASATTQAAQAAPPIHRRDLPDGVSLYELPAVRPLVGWASQVVAEPDLRSTVDLLTNKTAQVNLPGGVVIEWAKNAAPPSITDTGSIQVDRPRPEETLAKVNTPGPGLLVFNETYDPGWRAFVGGLQAPVHRVNAVAQGVSVPAGVHEVRFVYYPVGLRAGCIWTAGGILLLLAGAWATRRYDSA